jgi:hypothetical protein
MTYKSRLQKLTNKIKPEVAEVHYFGWADCTWSESEGLFRRDGESEEDFCNRVYQSTMKQFLWFD